MKAFILLILIFLSSSTLSASSFRVIALTTIEGVNTLEYQGPDGVEKVAVSTLGFSESYPIPEPGIIPLYDKMPVEGEDKAPMVSVNVANPTGDIIVLLHASSFNRFGYLLIEDTQSSFPLGSVLVLNFSERSIYAKFGENRLAVPSRESRVVELTKEIQKPFNDGVKFAAEFDGYGKVFSSSSWYLLPTMKIFCVVFPDENGNPRIRRIRLT